MTRTELQTAVLRFRLFLAKLEVISMHDSNDNWYMYCYHYGNLNNRGVDWK